jgi:uncharacterized membrane protein
MGLTNQRIRPLRQALLLRCRSRAILRNADQFNVQQAKAGSAPTRLLLLMSIRSPVTVCIISICIFVLALTQDGFYLDHVPRDAWAAGWGEFAVGWISVFYGTVAWLGNPLLIASWITLFRRKLKWSAFLAFVALLFMLSFLFNKRIVYNEAGSYSKIAGHGLGYWLWLLSAFVAYCGALLALKLSPKIAQMPNRSTDPTPASGTPPAGQEPRHG